LRNLSPVSRCSAVTERERGKRERGRGQRRRGERERTEEERDDRGGETGDRREERTQRAYLQVIIMIRSHGVVMIRIPSDHHLAHKKQGLANLTSSVLLLTLP